MCGNWDREIALHPYWYLRSYVNKMDLFLPTEFFYKHDETLVPNSGFNPDRRRGAPPFPSHHDPPTRLPPIDAIHGQLPSAAPPAAASSSRRPISDGVEARARASDTGGKGPEVLFS